jgi:hypothetical protein
MYYKGMIKDFTIYVIAGAVSFACLGLLALVMARDTIKDIDIGSSNE